MTKLDSAFTLEEKHGLVAVPGARYYSREFFDLEIEKLWPRVWQVACREEEVPNPGDFLEYTIGDQSIFVVRRDEERSGRTSMRARTGAHAFAVGVGKFATAQIRCRYHAWRWNLDGEIVEIVDRHDYPDTLTDDDVCLGEVHVGRWGGYVFVNMDPGCESLESFLGDIPERYAPYRFDQMRFRSYRTILFDCNWKTAVDSFNEGYHPQGLHPQMLTWFDDSMFVYEQIGQHSAYRQRERRREMGPSPRLGLARGDFDEARAARRTRRSHEGAVHPGRPGRPHRPQGTRTPARQDRDASVRRPADQGDARPRLRHRPASPRTSC